MSFPSISISWAVLWATVSLIVWLIMWAARTGPEQAVSNLAKWATLFGIHPIPAWLRDRTIDMIAYRWAGVAMVGLVAIGILGWVYSSIIPTEKIKEKIIVDVTPEYLMNLYKDNLSAQADKLVSPYIGNWIRVSGQIFDINGPDSLGEVTASFAKSGVLGVTTMNYDKKWSSILLTMRRGQNITALCQILDASTIDVHLQNCELLD
jgi:hypothetical protein